MSALPLLPAMLMAWCWTAPSANISSLSADCRATVASRTSLRVLANAFVQSKLVVTYGICTCLHLH
eukprot:7938147-Pyramimonas_sp.AAC.2